MTKNILLTDDDPGIQKTIRLLLEKAGFTVRVAGDGSEALEILDNGDFCPDCILLDIRMPGMEGTEALPRIREKAPMVPVIMLTAMTELEIAVETMRSGAYDYLTKPVRKVRLIETINKALKYREILLENDRLNRENQEYQRSLEKKVEERTRELFQAYEKLKATNLETVKVLAETIEAKDHYTRGHCNRVRILSTHLYRCVDPESPDVRTLEYGALLHDIGKIGIAEQLLHKTDPLSPEERELFQVHTRIGETILQNVEFFTPILPIVRNHHEWYDGNGYPDGIAGGDINLLTRIVSVVDAFDAMTSDRPYRRALPLDVALAELERGKGTQFDPELVDHFLQHKVYDTV
ncbi:MAG: HD domain-containing phosphohydrolase [Sediminispirochaetaceae bacterium]